MSDLDKSLENLSLDGEDIAVRHKKERKELQAKIQALKKTAGKGDKKKKKEVLEEIARLESDLDKRHADELAQAEKTTTVNSDHEQDAINQNDVESIDDDDKTVRVSRAQKRREKKLNEEKIRQAEILAQEEINKTGPRVIELNTIKNILAKRNLLLHPIASDGNCLYNALRNQLQVTGRNADDVQTLRNKTADYILQNKDSLIFYMSHPDTGDCLTDAEFERYCLDLKNTAAWGGQIEISALSQILQVPIEVIQATGPPTIQGDDKFKGPNLVITFHRAMYSLGEHYNGTKPLNKNTTDNDDNDE
ncbi:deubiquitinase OTUD6B [Contarinia nasturtii]|uniref:deubiquitinase OTUD6B n=1 Tax=Contarinia nasturtii TaxID=265458 RepID=UPI0012D3A4EE|nr:deubiquitinase OTUD6B [Contarinia nasturtii]